MSSPFLLLILDGWGANSSDHGNAIKLSKTPNWDYLLAEHPHRQLITHGEASGLPAGQMGNSEVGHMNIGAGRVVRQSLNRIDAAFAAGQVTTTPTWQDFLYDLSARRGNLHVLGLLSDGGVHSHQNHIHAICDLATAAGLRVNLHLILDGRDTEPQSASLYIERLQEFIVENPMVSIASLSGRYYAMDRDNRWERTELAYRAIFDLSSQYYYENVEQALDAAYARGETDEFVTPSVVGESVSVQPQDSIISCNFRADRMRQLCAGFSAPEVSFERRCVLSAEQLLTMSDYGDACRARVLFPKQPIVNDLGQWLSARGKKQLRIAETEKFPHVTYFFSGGKEEQYVGEQRILIPSPKVATYDLKPEMSADELVSELCTALESGQYDYIIANIANGDMVGHTGSLAAACRAVACVDRNLGRILESLRACGGQALITADHGNCEQMYVGASTRPHTAHTTNPVEIVYFGAKSVQFSAGDAKLADIAPTVLALTDMAIPPEMGGRVLTSQ